MVAIDCVYYVSGIHITESGNTRSDVSDTCGPILFALASDISCLVEHFELVLMCVTEELSGDCRLKSINYFVIV